MTDPNANTPIADKCKEHGCHYAGFLQQATGFQNVKADIEQFKKALSWIEDYDPQLVVAARKKFGL